MNSANNNTLLFELNDDAWLMRVVRGRSAKREYIGRKNETRAFILFMALIIFTVFAEEEITYVQIQLGESYMHYTEAVEKYKVREERGSAAGARRGAGAEHTVRI
jgi:hypothetical protein